MSRVPSSPYFFGPLKRAFLATLVVLVILAIVFPAPLEQRADPMKAPNPAKSAWFLLWLQELVSYDTVAIYAAVSLALLLIALPLLPVRPMDSAHWFHPAHRPVWIAALAAAAAIATLTVVAMFFRGSDWCFVLPF
ncbi:MAG: selenite/tellurite reduction operon b-type cytochrome membrane protein ExtQ [Thermoanaerobaculia bacterium]